MGGVHLDGVIPSWACRKGTSVLSIQGSSMSRSLSRPSQCQLVLSPWLSGQWPVRGLVSQTERW